MKDARMSIAYDFEGDRRDFDNRERYARPVLDGDNENHYGFGYCYEYDAADPLFVAGLEMREFCRLSDEEAERIATASFFAVVENGDVDDVRYHAYHRCGNVDAKNMEGKTLLCWAVELGKVGIVKFLIEEGADVNAENDDGMTALRLATELGKKKIAKFLASKS